MQTKLYRQQHGEILRHLDRIDAMLETAPEKDLSIALARLAGIVKMHLAMEDASMYPQMLASGDTDLRDKAREYQTDMGQLAAVYVAFDDKWTRSGAIEGNRAGFRREFDAVRAALTRRIERENGDLYDLIDRSLSLTP